MKEFYIEPDELLKKRKFVEYKERFIEPLFPKDKSIHILDIGSGYGLFLDACQKLGYTNYEGVENISQFVEYAEREFNLHDIACDDLFHYLESKPDNSYHVVTALNIVEHIKKEKVQYLLNLIHKKIKPGGMFILEVPNADSPLGIHTFFTDLTHEFAFSRKLILRLLRLAGFDTINVTYQPIQRNILVQLAQKIMAKIVGFEHHMMFSGNIIVISYKK